MRRVAAALVGLSLLVAFGAEAEARWGWLGVRIRDLSEQEMEEISQRHGLREGFGALIVEVIKETPAEAAGLRSGDVVVAIRDRPVVDTRTLQRTVGAAPVGEPMPVTVLPRSEGRQQVQVTVGRMPDTVAAERVGIEFGFVHGAEGRQRLDEAAVEVGRHCRSVNGINAWVKSGKVRP
jgi:S1-C subfamily serine protease